MYSIDPHVLWGLDPRRACKQIRGAAALCFVLLYRSQVQAWGTLGPAVEGGERRSPGPLAGLHSFGSTPIWLRFSSCLTVWLSVWLSVSPSSNCPGTCSQPYLTNLPSSPPTPLVTPFKALATAC